MVRFARSRNLALLAAGVLLAGSAPVHAAKKRAPRAPALPPAEAGAVHARTLRVPGSNAPPIDLNAAVPLIPPDTTELPLAAKGAIVMESLTGRVLYEKNADEPQFPASTTKILTALLVIEEGDLEHVIDVDIEDSKVGESGLNIQPGQRFTRREALYGLMLKSANDV